MGSQVIQVYVVTKKLGTIGFPLEIPQSSTFWGRDPLLPYFSVSKSRFLANFPAPHVDFSQPERLPASEEARRIGPSLLLRHSPLPIATDGKWNFHFKVFLAELRKPSRMKIRVTPPVPTVLPIHLPTSRRFCKSHCIAFSLGLF